jgi:hypothetical protein
MPGRIKAKKLSTGIQRDLKVAAAVAREAIVQLHVERALELIRHDLRMLVIYLRVHDVSGSEGDVVATRVLASLGRPPGEAVARKTAADEAQEEEGADERSLLRLLRRKLRGRVHDALRRTVELHIGVVQTALLELHVLHANGFVKLLAEHHPIDEACALYAEMVPVPPSLAGVLYILVLDRIAAEEMPAVWPAAPQAPGSETAADDTPPLPLTARAGRGPQRARHPA